MLASDATFDVETDDWTYTIVTAAVYGSPDETLGNQKPQVADPGIVITPNPVAHEPKAFQPFQPPALEV